MMIVVEKFNHNDFDHNRKLDLKMGGGRETCLRVIFLKINSTPTKNWDMLYLTLQYSTHKIRLCSISSCDHFRKLLNALLIIVIVYTVMSPSFVIIAVMLQIVLLGTEGVLLWFIWWAKNWKWENSTNLIKTNGKKQQWFFEC